MSIKLTDAKRYELEKDNVITQILNAERVGSEMTADILAQTLNIDLTTVDRLLIALRNDQIIV
jgi:transcription initiation factor IIE alpha subunit